MSQKLKVYFSHSRDPKFDYLSMYDFLDTSFPNIKWFFPHLISQGSNPVKEMFKAKEFDLVLAEVSFPSHGQGIELGYADMLSIPIFCINLKGQRISGSINSVTENIFEYSDFEDLKSSLDNLHNFTHN
jgi:hypothetical protein